MKHSIWILALLSLFCSLAKADESSNTIFENFRDIGFRQISEGQFRVPVPQSNGTSCLSSGTFLDKIVQAQSCISSQPVKIQTVNGQKVRDYVVAVLEKISGLIRIVKVRQSLRKGSELEVLTPGINLNLRHANGINSNFKAIVPDGGLVIAVKYPLQELPARIYTPYSPEIAEPELISEGMAVQSQFIAEAKSRLRQTRTTSRRFPGQLVADKIPDEIIRTLLIVEHINPEDFTGPDQAETLVNKVLVILGANKNLAYAHNISPSGARGLSQFMRGTYLTMAREYPEAGLNPDFVLGTADPINSIMAQILLCDHDWAEINKFKEIGPESVGPVLAVAYNSGASRAVKVVLNSDMYWFQNAYLGMPKKIFLPETMKYVVFYRWVRDELVRRAVPGVGNYRVDDNQGIEVKELQFEPIPKLELDMSIDRVEPINPLDLVGSDAGDPY